MLKQLSIRMKIILAILLAILFVTSLSAVAVEAHGGGSWGHPGWGWGRPWGGGWGYGPGCTWVGGNSWLCPSYPGMPYTIQNTTPAAPAPAPDTSNLAGATFFNGTI
jgi:hypothetical protein